MESAPPPPERDAVAEAYDRWSAQYDDDRNPTRDLDALVVRATPLHLAGHLVLEFGCGTGKNTGWLAERSAFVTALDFSEGMLNRARRNVTNRNVRFVQHDIRVRWPVSDASIDVVIGNLVLEHVEHLGPVFGEAARALHTGGRLLLCELHPYRQWRGGQAHFTDAANGETVHVPAYTHSVSEYVNTAVAHGFRLLVLGEWRDAGADDSAPPRLLSLLFEREAPHLS